MTQRTRIVLIAAALALPVGHVAWGLTRPDPVITPERADAIRVGMTKSEVVAILGGPAGDYAGNFAVTYLRGSVGADQSRYYDGTNWWGRRWMIQVRFDEQGLVKTVWYYTAHVEQPTNFWDGLWVRLTPTWPRKRHDWVPGGW
jgi:hypothetical protein